MADPQSLLQEGETLGPVQQAPVQHQGLLREGETLGEVVQAAPPTAPQPDGFGATLSREASSLVHAIHPLDLAKGIYHAAADPATQDEIDQHRAKYIHDIGPTGRLLERTMIEPTEVAANFYKKYVKASPDERIQMQSDMLNAAPEAVGVGGGGVLLAKAFQVAKAAASPMGAALPVGAAGPIGQSMLGRVGAEVGTNVPFTGTQISDLANRGASAVGDAAADAARATGKAAANATGRALYQGGKIAAKGAINAGQGVVDAVNEHINGLKSDIADEVHKAIQNPSGHGMHEDISHIIKMSADGAEHVTNAASEIAQTILDKIKENARTSSQVSQGLVDKIVNRVVDEYYLRKNPTVSGGAPDDVADAVNRWNAPAGTSGVNKVNADAIRENIPPNTEAPYSDQLPPDEVSPLKDWNVQDDPEANFRSVGAVGADKPSLRSPLATLAQNEKWAAPLKDVLTRGQRNVGLWQWMETYVRRSPVLGRIFSEGADVNMKEAMTQTLREASMDPTLSKNARVILKGAASGGDVMDVIRDPKTGNLVSKPMKITGDIARNGRFNLVKTIQAIDDGLNQPGKFVDFESPGQVGVDSTARMKLLRDALAQTQHDIEASTRFGVPAPAGTLFGEIKAVAQLLGKKWIARTLSHSSEANESQMLNRLLGNVPQVPERAGQFYLNAKEAFKNSGADRLEDTDYYKNLPAEKKILIDRYTETLMNRFRRVWHGVGNVGMPKRVLQPGQTPVTTPEWNMASAHPGSHAFSFKQWLQQNPQGSPNDARQAGRDAEEAGYEVNS